MWQHILKEGMAGICSRKCADWQRSKATEGNNSGASNLVKQQVQIGFVPVDDNLAWNQELVLAPECIAHHCFLAPQATRPVGPQGNSTS